MHVHLRIRVRQATTTKHRVPENTFSTSVVASVPDTDSDYDERLEETEKAFSTLYGLKFKDWLKPAGSCAPAKTYKHKHTAPPMAHKEGTHTSFPDHNNIPRP